MRLWQLYRRPQVADATSHAGAFLIEDDYARDLSIDGEAPPPLAADDAYGHVIYLRSLTKSAAPGLRVAAIGARGPAGARLRSAWLLDDLYVAGPLVQALLGLRPAAPLRTIVVDPHLPDIELEGVQVGGATFDLTVRRRRNRRVSVRTRGDHITVIRQPTLQARWR